MNKPAEFTLKMPAEAIQVILDVLDQTPMPQRVSRPITDMIVKQVNEAINSEPSVPAADAAQPQAAADPAPAGNDNAADQAAA